MADEAVLNLQPVPAASQLAIIPFVAAVDGLLRDGSRVPSLHLTVRRAVTFDGRLYLQQICPYVIGSGLDGRFVGQASPITVGMMGAAFARKKIWRTRKFDSLEMYRSIIKNDLEALGDTRTVDDVALSYLCIPFLGCDGEALLVLFAQCMELNFFASDERIQHVIAMGRGFCRLFDSLQAAPLPDLANVPNSGELQSLAARNFSPSTKRWMPSSHPNSRLCCRSTMKLRPLDDCTVVDLPGSGVSPARCAARRGGLRCASRMTGTVVSTPLTFQM